MSRPFRACLSLPLLLAALFACEAGGGEARLSAGTPEADEEPLVITERDAVHMQVFKCWNFPLGGKNPEEQVVKLRVELNPDGTAKTIEVLDRARYESDTYFRTAADAARRAVKRCSPLRLPASRYNDWKELILTFDPKIVFSL